MSTSLSSLEGLIFFSVSSPIQSNAGNGAREVHMKTRDGWMAEATLRPRGWESTVHEKTAMLPGPLCRVIASSSLGLLGLLQNELWKLKFLEHFRHEQNCNCQKLLQMVLFSPFPRRIPHTRSRAMNHRIFPSLNGASASGCHPVEDGGLDSDLAARIYPQFRHNLL